MPLEQALRRLGLAGPGEPIRLSPLTGGVSSDIYLAELSDRHFCVKRALPTLKVAAHWEAPVSRNSAEACWFRRVRRWLPDNVPEVLAEDAEIGMFAMTFLPPEDYPVWKAQLMAGDIDPGVAAAVGTALATIHSRSAGDPTIAVAFNNDDTFEAIRLEPYLRATAQRHPDLAHVLQKLADTTAATKLALVHGDVSPKNILVGPNGPVFLDAECAWVRRPRLRPGILPQPPAPERRVAAGIAGRVLKRL
jgi:5-methylthioribose kinase